MPEIKKDCFAYMSDNQYRGCMCLNELFCRKENCKFYKTKEEAKKDYLDNYNVSTAQTISKSTDNFFRELTAEKEVE